MISVFRLFNFQLAILCGVSLIYAGAVFAQSELPPDIGDDFKFHKPAKRQKGRIAFTTTIGKYERIFVLDVASGSVYPVISGPGNARYPAWHSSGKKLLFTSDRKGTNNLYRAEWDGTKVKPVTASGVEQGHPDMQRGGKAYYFANEGENTNIFRSNIWRKESERVTNFSGRNITPRISPRGDLIAYTTNRFWPGWDVCLFDLKYKVETCPLQGNVSYCRPAWHDSGRKFLFSTGEGKDIDIGLYDLDQKNYRILTNLPNREYDAVWAPDYKSFAFVAEPDKLNQFQMYLFADGSPKPQLLLSGPYPIRYLAWHKTPTLKLEAEKMRKLDEDKKKKPKKGQKKKPEKKKDTNKAEKR